MAAFSGNGRGLGNYPGSSRSQETKDAQPSHLVAAPALSLPKGGGAIRGIGEKFAANPVTGTGSMTVPIATSPGRSGFGPQLSLSYDSGAGNGPFGFGWSLSLPSITRKTDKGLPQYLDAEESDVYILSGAEDLVPVLSSDGTRHVDKDTYPDYIVHRYRPRIEGLFARIERWTNKETREIHWRSITRDNVTTLYGRDNKSRIFDPADLDKGNPADLGKARPVHIFSWLIYASYDDKGNAVIYKYECEDSQRIFEDQKGRVVALAHEGNRNDATRSANRYLKRIKYGNRMPNRHAPTWQATDPAQLPDDTWMFEVVFDYGEGHYTEAAPDAQGRVFAQAQIDPPVGSHWPARQDPFSTYRAGFEVRTYRLCYRVLMFHHIPDISPDEKGYDGLVRSTDFTYSHQQDPTNSRNPVYTFLSAITQTGYKREGGGYLKRSLPPVEFAYTQPVVQDMVEEVDGESLENLPVGLDGTTYQWTDLHGEGIPGILTEQAGAWFYKRNLSPINLKLGNGLPHIEAKFAHLELVATKPNLAVANGAQLMDLAGDGQPDLVVLDGPVAGLYEHDDAEGWHPFRPFTAQLNRDMRDPNLKFVDLDGDGHADVLISEDNAFVWHASLTEEGFGPAHHVAQALDEETGPRLVFGDRTQSIYLADISGDGLTDLVRIRNGEVSYWPNLGYGRFGAKVTMDQAPYFDNPDQFDQKRIRLADIDGSGITDIIYLHHDGVRLYFNQSGNSWSQPQHLKVFPRIDDLMSVVPIDLLGNGTACLVWSSPLPGDARHPMRYVNLMGKDKPHLLVKTINNLGAETRVAYAPSTKFYLQDKRDGKPWITRLPFPVHVVECVETYDHISRNRFLTRYAYHHGYFDGEEREFRGFGMVEQWDTEEFAALADGKASADNIAPASHVPPVHTRTWFHTGVYLGRERVSNYFAGLVDGSDRGDYYREPAWLDDDDEAKKQLLPDTIFPAGLSLDEEREACRALKGSMLRQEVYALDGVGVDGDYPYGQPYTVTEQNFTIRTLQPRDGNRHAVFFTHPCEAITYHYERNPADPRVQHGLTLEVDGYGNVLKQVAIGYGRRASSLKEQWDRERQTTSLLTYTENRFTKDHDTGRDAVDRDDHYRVPLLCEALTFELTGYTPSGAAGRYQASDFVEPDPAIPGRLRHKFTTPEVAYNATAAGHARRRPIEWLRTIYRRDDLTGLLPLGDLQPLALPGEGYKLALTPGLLDQVFQRPRPGQPDEPLLPAVARAALLGGQAGNQGGYVDLDGSGYWWLPSGRSYFSTDPATTATAELAQARQHFFLPRRYRDPFGQDAVVDFDANDLLMTETRDALGNRVTVSVNDYRVLQPRLISDPNRNRTEVAFDTLGMVVGTAVMGKPLPAPVEGDTLTGFIADLTQAQIDSLFEAANPHAVTATLLQDGTTRIIYDLDRFRRTRQAKPDDPSNWHPACAATLARETHVHAPLPPQGLKIQLSFSYSDGFGREIQMKIQAEPGPVPQRDDASQVIVGADGQPVMTAADANPRWVGSGWTVFNNKGKPVRQYEPFFTHTHRFEFDVRIGVSSVLFYDPAERIIATLHPNHTYEKVVFDPWQQSTYDVNDTCAAHNAQTGDPRTDPNISGYVQEYFKSLPVDALKPWQTWYAQRIGGVLGPHERTAAERGAAHANTPTTTHFDALGRPFLTVARNRVICANHPLDGKPDEEFRTRVELDIEGNQLKVFDERKLLDAANLPLGAQEQRTVMQYTYDMLGNRIHQLSMEAGVRWMLNDVAGKPIRAWDSRGHNFTTKYDALRRPIEQNVRGTFSDPIPLKPNSDPRTLNPPSADGLLIDRIEYGESIANAEAFNLRTRIYRHVDSAGIATNGRLDANGDPTEAYDFKGNLLRSMRQLVSDYKDIPDWSQNPALDSETFEGSTRFDALNRPIQSIAPTSSLTRPGHPNKFNVIQPVFNEANLLERVDVWLERAAEPSALVDPDTEAPSPVGVADIDYDAKGQRTLIDYKTRDATVIRTTYAYDPETLRLTHLYTRRGVNPTTAQGVAFANDCENPNPPPSATIAAPEKPPAGKACGLQNLHYTYDPAGNITHIRDDAQQTIYFRNRRVEPINDYVYDALYRLIQANGREHLGQLASGERLPPTAPDGFNAFHTHLDHPGNGQAMGTYTERYVYDAVGNLLQMQHRGSDPAHAGWTRTYDYLELSLIEPGKHSNRLSRTTLNPAGNTPQPETYLHDAQGNMLRMPHVGDGLPGPNMLWDYKNQLRQIDKGGGGTAWYVYDASGQRVRKVWEKAPGLTEERIYLGGFEIFRRHGGAIGAKTATLERETLHVMDDKQRIALVETRTLDMASNDQAPRQLIRYQLGNHLGSASLELDKVAEIISYEEYTPYGSTSYWAVRSQTETRKRYRYTSKERDEETGLYYHGARYYAPWLGRWASCDPAGVQTRKENLYEYVRSNPVIFRDPSGADEEEGLFSEVVKGDFHEGKTTWSGTLLNVGVGLIPIVGQIADARDTAAAIKNVWNDPRSGGNWGMLGMAAVGWLPGVGDAIKGGSKVGRKVLKEGVEELAKEAAEKAAKEAAEKATKEAAEKAAKEAAEKAAKEVAGKEATTSAKSVTGSSKPRSGEVLVGSSTKQMRRAAAKKIASDPDHPLRFLLDESGQFKKQAGLTQHAELINRPDLVQMGHIQSKKIGGKERVMLQGAWENQFNNISIESPHIGGAVLDQPAIAIGGVAVDLKTAKFWEEIGFLKPGTVGAAPRIAP